METVNPDFFIYNWEIFQKRLVLRKNGSHQEDLQIASGQKILKILMLKTVFQTGKRIRKIDSTSLCDSAKSLNHF